MCFGHGCRCSDGVFKLYEVEGTYRKRRAEAASAEEQKEMRDLVSMAVGKRKVFITSEKCRAEEIWQTVSEYKTQAPYKPWATLPARKQATKRAKTVDIGAIRE